MQKKTAGSRRKNTKNYYDLFGVTRKATDEEIKSAYKKLALKWHPDKHRADVKAHAKAEKAMREITRIYETLMDGNERAVYDRSLDGPIIGPAKGLLANFFGQK